MLFLTSLSWLLVLQRDFFWSILKGSIFLEVKCYVDVV